MRNNITGEWNTESGWMTIAAPVEVSRAEDALLAARQPKGNDYARTQQGAGAIEAINWQRSLGQREASGE